MKRKFDRSKFMKRSYSMYADHRRKLNETAFGKDKTKWPEETLAMPFPLDLLRLNVENALLDLKPCSFCGTPLKLSNISLDHCIPQTRRAEFSGILEPFAPLDIELRGMSLEGATDFALLLGAYSWANLALCCERCNRRKGELTAVEFTRLLELVNSFPVAAQKYVLRKLAQKPPFFRKDKAAA